MCPTLRLDFAIGDQYKSRVLFQGTKTTKDAVAAWNPCRHYIRLKILSVQKTPVIGLRR